MMTSTSSNGKPGGELTALSVLVLGLGVLVVVAGLFGTDQNLARIIQYFSSAVPIVIGFAFMNRKQEDNDSKTEETRQNVGYLSGTLNGNLDKRFAALEAKFEATRPAIIVEPDAGEITVKAPTPTGQMEAITDER